MDTRGERGPQLKKEPCKAWLASGSPKVIDSYQQAKLSAARLVTVTKHRVWEEFGAPLEEDFQSTLKKPDFGLHCQQ